MKKIFLALCAFALVFSCQKADETSGTITLKSPTEVTIPTAGDIAVVEFTATGAWKASLSERDWATVNQNFGEAGTFSVKVPFLPNEDEENSVRTAVLTLTCGKDVKTVTFNQLQKDGIHVEKSSLKADFLPQDIIITVYSNVELSCESDVSWIIPADTKKINQYEYLFGLEMNKTDEDRVGVITFTGGDTSTSVTLTQTPFDPQISFDPGADLTVGFAEGSTTVTVNSNLAYNMLPLDEEASAWLAASLAGGVITLDYSENGEMSSRSAALTLEFPDYAEGEGVHTETITLTQTGTLEVIYNVDLPAEIASGRFSMAKLGDNILVCNSAAVYAFEAATGAYVGDVSTGGIVPSGITNDDAGNVVISEGGDYDGDLSVYVLPSTATSFSEATKIIGYHLIDFYGYGLNNIRVTGDVTGKAVVTMVSGGAKDYGCADYAVSWQVTDGAVEGAGVAHTDYVTLPEAGDNVWSSYSIVAMHATNDINSGLFYMGYDGLYNLYYNPGMSSANWTEVLQSGSTWAEGYNAMDVVEWNGHKYLGFIGMGYFPTWGMPSYQWLVNVDDPAAPATVATLDYLGNGDGSIDSTDAHLEVNGKDLDYYVIDGPNYILRLVKFYGK